MTLSQVFKGRTGKAKGSCFGLKCRVSYHLSLKFWHFYEHGDSGKMNGSRRNEDLDEEKASGSYSEGLYIVEKHNKDIILL